MGALTPLPWREFCFAPFIGLCFAPRMLDGMIRSRLSSLGLTCFDCWPCPAAKSFITLAAGSVLLSRDDDFFWAFPLPVFIWWRLAEAGPCPAFAFLNLECRAGFEASYAAWPPLRLLGRGSCGPLPLFLFVTE